MIHARGYKVITGKPAPLHLPVIRQAQDDLPNSSAFARCQYARCFGTIRQSDFIAGNLEGRPWIFP
jgi:hypothetical protein